MTDIAAKYELVMETISHREGAAPEFLQAVNEVGSSLLPLFKENPKYLDTFAALAEPERTIMFRVPWEADDGTIKVNRGFRIQFSSALGPYKGGLRFHPTVNLSIIKFLGFEQIFKNSLTTLPMGAGKGGSDFDPKGKTDSEVRRFCHSFMTELQRHIGPDTDVPAGDIGVGGREIGFMYGQYKRLRNESTGVLTGKDPKWGGSLIRPEATGYGTVYFVEHFFRSRGGDLKGKRCIVSGSGNVAQYCVEKLIQLGAIPLTLSDSSGSVYEPEGFTTEKLAAIMHLKNNVRGRLSQYCDQNSSAVYYSGKSVWEISGLSNIDAAFPCATQNEISVENAMALAKSGCKVVGEGANMPSTDAACHQYKKDGVVLCPGKAANAGGVAVSGLEMSQNSQRLSWTREQVDQKLSEIMSSIYTACRENGQKYGSGPDDLVTGANIAGFLKVADSMTEFGWA